MNGEFFSSLLVCTLLYSLPGTGLNSFALLLNKPLQKLLPGCRLQKVVPQPFHNFYRNSDCFQTRDHMLLPLLYKGTMVPLTAQMIGILDTSNSTFSIALRKTIPPPLAMPKLRPSGFARL